MNALICKRCRRPIDQDTIDWFARRRPEKPPRVCGWCMVVAMDNLAIECLGKPIFDENWQTIKPGDK